jgi:hypothetical protein
MTEAREDRILRPTRIVSVIIIPFVLLAFLVLYFIPEQSAQHFAWEIRPTLTALFMGTGYLGGAYFFLYALFGRRWHHVGAGFPAIATFATAMLILTILHWGRFDLSHFPFQLWLALYLIAPPLVVWMWWNNRGEDPGVPEPNDVLLPVALRWAAAAVGAGFLLFALASFVLPSLLIAIWPWTLTVVTARIMAGWMMLNGMVSIVLSQEERWSGWKVPVQAFTLWHMLFLIGALLNVEEFAGGTLLNWYMIGVIIMLLGGITLYLVLEMRRKQDGRQVSGTS